MLTWDKPNERYYEHGLDRGVLYIPGQDPIPWNGLTGFDEGGEAGTTSMLYRDGVVYLADSDATDFQGKMRALFFPDQFGKCVGIPRATDGLYVDNQKPTRFGLSYRTLIGSGGESDRFGYQIHLVYNCMASISPRERRTIGKDTDPTTFEFEIVCTPVKLPGYRPTAHYIIDTRNMSADKLASIEDQLYGDGVTPGALPAPADLFDLLNYGDAIQFTVHTDGTYTVVGSADNFEQLTPHSFLMKGINATDNLDGTYLVADGGNTTVILE